MFTEVEVVEAIAELTSEKLRIFVEQGWVRPEHQGTRTIYSEIDLARLRLVCQLTDQLDVNREAVPLILSLVDQVYGLRRELRDLAQAVEKQPRAVQRAILEARDELD